MYGNIKWKMTKEKKKYLGNKAAMGDNVQIK